MARRRALGTSATAVGSRPLAAGVRGLQIGLRYFTVAGATHHKHKQHRSSDLQSWESEVQNQSELKSRWAGLVPAEAPGSLALASIPSGAPALLGSRPSSTLELAVRCVRFSLSALLPPASLVPGPRGGAGSPGCPGAPPTSGSCIASAGSRD